MPSREVVISKKLIDAVTRRAWCWAAHLGAMAEEATAAGDLIAVDKLRTMAEDATIEVIKVRDAIGLPTLPELRPDAAR